MSTESSTEPKEPKTEIKQDKAYSYAYAIKEGKANGKYLYCLEDNKFYHYNDGYWEPLFDVEFLGRVQENIKELTRFSLPRRKQIVENFKQLGRKHLSGFNWSELINLKNGMVSAHSGELIEHDSIFFSTNRLPYMYDENAKCELWLKSLNEIFEGDIKKINVLQEFFGYCLTRETKHHKALLLLGESRSGKSTILHVLRNMVGNENCSAVPLKYISNPQHTPDLVNKLVNIDTDVSGKAEEFEAEFKTITSGEPVRTSQKYVVAFSFIPYCKMAMGANIFPRITDHSSAFYNRLILIPCDRVFSYEEQNRDLPTQLLGELPGILLWSIKGLKELKKRGKFEELDFMKDAVKELENENNPTNLFFEEHIDIVMGTEIEKGELFEKYKQWCDKNKQYSLSNARFSIAVYKHFKTYTPKDTQNPDSKKRIWRNIQYVNIKSHVVKEDINWET